MLIAMAFSIMGFCTAYVGARLYMSERKGEGKLLGGLKGLAARIVGGGCFALGTIILLLGLAAMLT